jgi:hypothetical protein
MWRGRSRSTVSTNSAYDTIGEPFADFYENYTDKLD